MTLRKSSQTTTTVWLPKVFQQTARALAAARRLGWQFDIMSSSFFLSRRALRLAVRSGMPRWQDRLFIGLARSSDDATDYFQIPTDRVVEVGTQGHSVISELGIIKTCRQRLRRSQPLSRRNAGGGKLYLLPPCRQREKLARSRECTSTRSSSPLRPKLLGLRGWY
jgi:hypothetical protein